MKAIAYMFTGAMFCLACGLPWVIAQHWYQAAGIDLAILFLSVGSMISGSAIASDYW